MTLGASFSGGGFTGPEGARGAVKLASAAFCLADLHIHDGNL